MIMFLLSMAESNLSTPPTTTTMTTPTKTTSQNLTRRAGLRARVEQSISVDCAGASGAA